MDLPLNVKYTRPLISVQDMVNFIDKGERYLKEVVKNYLIQNQLEFLQGIILSHDYQREYRQRQRRKAR